MSKENLEQFMSKVADSEELQAKIGEEIDAEALIALGAECGCEFTAEAIAEYVELSDEDLDGVAGGGRTRGKSGGFNARVVEWKACSRKSEKHWCRCKPVDKDEDKYGELNTLTP